MQKTILLILFFQIIHWNVMGQTITIQSSKISVGEVFKEITEQTDLDFSYNPDDIDVKEIIDFNVRKSSVEKTLKILCDKINVEYSLLDGQIILYQPNISSKKNPILSGFLTDEKSGESLIGATVAIEGTSIGTITNEFGFYSLSIKQDVYKFQYSYLGYEIKEVELEILKDKKLDQSLKMTSIDLPDVVVNIDQKDKLDEMASDGLEFSSKALEKMPEFGGESGLIQGLQSLPGIKMHSDGSAFYYVRGGERDQNLIIIDDAPIYNPSHLFGFYSLVIPDFTKSIKVYKSDIPANLGDQLSSITSIRTNDGNLNNLVASAAINPLVYRFTLEAPIKKKLSSILVSYRRSNFNRTSNESINALKFGDGTIKWNRKINDNNRIFFTTFWSTDEMNASKLNEGRPTGLSWGNFAATFRWNYIITPKLFSNTIIYTGNYGYRLSFSPNFWQSALASLSLKSDFTHFANSKLTSKFGFESKTYFINPGGISVDSTLAILPDIKPNFSRKNVLYYQSELELNEKWKLNAGLRYIAWENHGPTTYFDFNDNYEVIDTIEAKKGAYHKYFHLDPRVSLQYRIDQTSRLSLSLGRYHQYLQLISNSPSPFTSMEIWLPSGPNIRPQASTQLALNYFKFFEKEKAEFSVATYYKKSENQIDYRPHAITLLNPLVEGELRFGKSWSYGIEFYLKKEVGRLNGWASYTYARVFRQFDDLNEGKSFPAFQDRPHDFSLLLNYKLKKRLSCSVFYTIKNGATFSSPTGFYTFNEQTLPIYAEKNNDRLPTYQRLDLGVKFILNKKPDNYFQHSLTFSVYNFLAHKNIYSVQFNRIPSERIEPVVKANVLSETALIASQADLVRFLPSITYKIKVWKNGK